ncbi:50S ribosomal protein L18 [Candidatus Woesearchaeota archaeon]|nr:50S ribosomal protein L18 [Candidatus Woesearchaeota archaeon]RLE40868.1 MAG: 50S ribosomal protein L18 [Candidatus Woesearchaeota archaeon]
MKRKDKIFTVQFRRKREDKTNYRKRIELLKSGKPRLVVRPFLKNIIAQIIEFDKVGDRTLVSATGYELEKFGWHFSKGNIPAAYLTGLLVGKKGLKKGIKEAVLDIDGKTPLKGTRVFACLKGAVDAGLVVPHSEDVFPSEERLRGEHIKGYFELGKWNSESQFAEMKKKGVDLGKITDVFEEVRKKIMEM